MQTFVIASKYLQRKVQFDMYHSSRENQEKPAQMILFNDGQDLLQCRLSDLLHELEIRKLIQPLIVVGIYSDSHRKQEYGIAGHPDFKNRGSKADMYTSFIMKELIPLLNQHLPVEKDLPKSFAGFSLGGLSALDIVWQHPDVFSKAGIFSGSLWWRKKDLRDHYKEDADRIMLNRIREGTYYRELKFFFECGTDDETEDRNNNGIIDVIDDTLDVIDALVEKGYSYPGDILYHEITGGRHDSATWKQALPEFFRFLHNNI